jgi:hypothetical protein
LADATQTTDPARPSLRRSLPWWLMVALALTELGGHALVRSRVPAESDWEEAAAFVDARFEEGDMIAVGPDWADPLLRLHLGEHIDLRMAGASDLAPFDRLWELSIRGEPSRWRPEGDEAVLEAFGRVTVRRWDLGPSPVRFDLTSNLERAKVSQGPRSCRWRTSAPSGGGLGRGPLKPRGHHFCGPQGWLFVGETVNEDLELLPRHCVWQHPAQGEPVTTTYEDIPLGDRLVLYAGLYSEHERMEEHPPVRVRVTVDGEPVGSMVHRDGDGWKRMEAAMPDRERGDVSVIVEADVPHLRTLCWAATTREGERR